MNPTALQAGPELDAEVARRVFDLRVERGAQDLVSLAVDWFEEGPEYWLRQGDGASLLPLYSIEIDAAWMIVDHLFAQGWGVDLNHVPGDGPWTCTFWHDRYTSLHEVEAPTAPLAICAAALAAIGGD